MTAQIHDKFIYKRAEYCISALEFPDACIDIYSLLGFVPRSITTACWRGYVATYALKKGMLVLKKLYTNNGNNIENEIPRINNKLPEISIRKGLIDEFKNTLRDFTYKNIDLKIQYTGSIVITRDFFIGKRRDCKIAQLTFDNGQWAGWS
jgi:hypothetical protein